MRNLFQIVRAARRILQSLCVATLLLTCAALPAQNERSRVRNIVLVHGAWVPGGKAFTTFL